MLQSKVEGVRIAAMSTTLPSEKKMGSDNTSYYISDELQTTSDLGFDAAERILLEFSIPKENIGVLLFGSKTPDYRSPNTAAILQGRLGLSIDCICFDTNVGANGFLKIIQLAAAVLAKSNTEYALVIVGDTPSKLQNKEAGINFEISDAATAVLLQKSSSADVLEFLTYSSGNHFKSSYLKEGGFRDFNERQLFDGSNACNFIVKSQSQDLKEFFEDISPIVKNLLQNDSNHHLISCNILDNLTMTDIWSDQRTINADASELPLLLENLTKSKQLTGNKLQFISVGEGMALMVMKINYVPKVLPQNFTLDHFEDYKVSHEM